MTSLTACAISAAASLPSIVVCSRSIGLGTRLIRFPGFKKGVRNQAGIPLQLLCPARSCCRAPIVPTSGTVSKYCNEMSGVPALRLSHSTNRAALEVGCDKRANANAGTPIRCLTNPWMLFRDCFSRLAVPTDLQRVKFAHYVRFR